MKQIKTTSLIVALFCFLAQPGLVAQASEVEKAELLYQQAMRLFQEDRPEEAETLVKKAVNLDPQNYRYHFELANIYAVHYDRLKRKYEVYPEHNLLDASGRELIQTIMLNPEFIPGQYNLGVVYKNQGRYEEAREQFRTVLELDPKQLNAHMQMGVTYQQQGFFDEALDHFSQARQLGADEQIMKDALESLNQSREVFKSRASMDLARSRLMGNGMGYSPHSQAESYQMAKNQGIASQRGAVQALPFLGAWLFQEFMNARNG